MALHDERLYGMNSTEWLSYFRQNQSDRLPICWHEGVHVCRHLRRPLASSLSRFQLGESSDGSRLLAAARCFAAQTGDGDYREAIALFIAEEQEHSRLLAKLLEQMQGVPLRFHWTDQWFRRCRHLLGFYEEISVLLMAEIVALKYYSVVRRGAEDAIMAKVCEQILHDEKFHVRFHCEFLHGALKGRSAMLHVASSCTLNMMFAGASALVAWDHRTALTALGCSSWEFLRDSWNNFVAARRAIFSGEAFTWSGPGQQVVAQAAPLALFQRFSTWRGVASVLKTGRRRARKRHSLQRDAF
jgi:hypothetical protein